jgi:Secretion system C-terminal sorting domain
MKERYGEILSKRLLSYSLTSAALLAGTGNVHAQVWGYDVNPDANLAQGEQLSIDFNGNTAFIIRHFGSGLSNPYFIFPQTGSAEWIHRVGGKAKPLSSGYSVRSSATSGWSNGGSNFRFALNGSSGNTGASFFGSDKYIGVRFKISGSYHYGWILVHVSGNGSGLIIKSYAYNETAGAPITANGTLPVELKNFSAVINNNKVNLKWATATEVNNYGFEIERYALSAERKAFEKIGFVQGAGNSNSPNNYSFVDANPLSGDVEYRLKLIDNDGAFKYSSIVTLNSLPAKYELFQNYPNPFNPTTTIKYSLPKAQHVTLKLYDELGKEVSTLVNENKEIGSYSVTFNGEGFPSGIYYYRLTSGEFTEVKKLMLLK